MIFYVTKMCFNSFWQIILLTDPGISRWLVQGRATWSWGLCTKKLCWQTNAKVSLCDINLCNHMQITCEYVVVNREREKLKDLNKHTNVFGFPPQLVQRERQSWLGWGDANIPRGGCFPDPWQSKFPWRLLHLSQVTKIRGLILGFQILILASAHIHSVLSVCLLKFTEISINQS